LIVGFARIPRLQNLISQPLINQQRFDVHFGEHGLLMSLLHTVNMYNLCKN